MEREFRGLSGQVILHYAARIETRFGIRGSADPFHFAAEMAANRVSADILIHPTEANRAHRGQSQRRSL
jgi:hypothetical protein